MDRILIADDDVNIAQLIADSLKDEGLASLVVSNGDEALAAIGSETFALILLDVMMPGADGMTVLKAVRDQVTCPIIFLTAKSRMVDLMLGLELGADDYIKKPFVVEELVAKIKAHIRRDHRTVSPRHSIITFGDLSVDRESFEVQRAGRKIDLTTREFQLLVFLIDNAGRVLTREQIFDGVWGRDFVEMSTVTVTIKNLRTKIDQDGELIKTVWGVGYKLAKK